MTEKFGCPTCTIPLYFLMWLNLQFQPQTTEIIGCLTELTPIILRLVPYTNPYARKTCVNLSQFIFWFNRLLTGMIFLMEFISVFAFLEYNLQKMNDLSMSEYYDDDEFESVRYAEEQRRKIQKEKQHWNNSIEGD